MELIFLSSPASTRSNSLAPCIAFLFCIPCYRLWCPSKSSCVGFLIPSTADSDYIIWRYGFHQHDLVGMRDQGGLSSVRLSHWLDTTTKETQCEQSPEPRPCMQKATLLFLSTLQVNSSCQRPVFGFIFLIRDNPHLFFRAAPAN